MLKKLITTMTLLLFVTPSYAAYEEIDCSADQAFWENSCNQCFNWWSKMQWDHLWLLSDLWMNVTDVTKILYKEEQVDPEMINLNTDNVTWIQTPNAENFWEYTDEFNTLYSENEEWYILTSWKSVTWIKSNLSSSYKLERNNVAAWDNIGMLVYPIATHNILADGEITIDNSEHIECVLFKSAESANGAVESDNEPKQLPQTWPSEYILLAFIAMVLGFWILQFRIRS
jgi:hypothetical protein